MGKVVNPDMRDRFARALAYRGRSTRQLAADVAEHFRDRGEGEFRRNGDYVPPKGATYGGIRALAAGEIKRPRGRVLEAVAEVLRVREPWLARGEGEMTDAEQAQRESPRPTRFEGLTYTVDADAPHARRTEALVHLVINEYLDLPMEAREMMFNFAGRFFVDMEGWDNWAWPGDRRATGVGEVMRHYYGPLIDSPPPGEFNKLALAASLTAAAYLRLSAIRSNPPQEEE